MGQTGFILACACGMDFAIELLLNEMNNLDLDPNLGDLKGRTGLMWACIKGKNSNSDVKLINPLCSFELKKKNIFPEY